MPENFGKNLPPIGKKEPASKDLKIPGSVSEEDIKGKIEDIAKRYGFEELGWTFSDGSSQDNKVILSMLDEYLKADDLQLSEDKVSILDFGSGFSPYLNGLLNFLLKRGKKTGEIRKVNYIVWEGNDQCPSPTVDDKYNEFCEPKRIKGYLTEKGIESDDGYYEPQIVPIERRLRRYDVETHGKQLDIVTMFDLGPSPGHLKTGGDYLSVPLKGIKPFIKEGGIVLLTTTLGGQQKEKAIEILTENGFEVVVNEKNKYKDYFTEFPHHHDNIIVARKKTEHDK
jgi:hypothetical protein